MKVKNYIRDNNLKCQIDNCKVLPEDLRFIEGRVANVDLKCQYVRKFNNFYSKYSVNVEYNSVEYESVICLDHDEIKYNGPVYLKVLEPIVHTKIPVFCACKDIRDFADVAQRLRDRYYLPFSSISFPCISRKDFDMYISNKIKLEYLDECRQRFKSEDIPNSNSLLPQTVEYYDLDVKYENYSSVKMYPFIIVPDKKTSIMPYRIHKRSYSRGVQEALFEQFLYRFIKVPYQVRGDICVVNDLDLFYEPDIAIVCHNKPYVHIDIEIDEPYSVNNEPIHYIECDNDQKRNKYFVDNGWIVIRFSERQITLYPKGCLNVIEDVLSSVDPTYLPEDISLNEQIVSECHWSLEEARQMIATDERSKYLGTNIVQKNVHNSGGTFPKQQLTESEIRVRAEVKSQKGSDLQMEETQQLSFSAQIDKNESWWRRILHCLVIFKNR